MIQKERYPISRMKSLGVENLKKKCLDVQVWRFFFFFVIAELSQQPIIKQVLEI